MINYIGNRLTMKIITDNYLDPYEKQSITVERGWKERLFKFPWRPLQKTKEVLAYDYTKPLIYKVDDYILCHSSLVSVLEDLLNEKNSTVPLANKSRIL